MTVWQASAGFGLSFLSLWLAWRIYRQPKGEHAEG